MTLPAMVWWARPQYSWQTKVYSPAFGKRVVMRVIWPGISMTLTSASGRKRPWMTSRLVATKVTSEPSGTRMTGGLKNQTPPMMRAS